ncbi:MAG: type II secretion system F family protein [Proteobacteria bacterium]|nr:type II secretion system F family protein [Pseudomonadota bacterium]
MSGAQVYPWLAVAVALALFCALQAGYWWARGRRRRAIARASEGLLGMLARAAPQGIQIRARARAASQLGRLAALPAIERLRDALAQGGFAIDARRFLLVAAAAAGGTLILGLVVGAGWLGAAVLAALVCLGLHVHVTRRCEARLRVVDAQLPRALESMVFSLRAGRGLEEAVRSAAEETEPPLSVDLRRCYEEYALGRPIEAALQQLRTRWPAVRALYSFVEAVAVLKRTGGNLVEVMETLIETLRLQAAHQARHRALTAEGRVSGLILTVLPLLAVAGQALVSPGALVTIAADASGRMILLTAAALWAVGAVWVARLGRPGRGGA